MTKHGFMFQSIIIRVFFGERLFRLCHSADSCFSIKIEIYPFIWHDGVGNMKGATSFSYRLWANPFSSSDVGYQTNSVLFSFHNTIAFSNFEFIGILPFSLRRNIILLQLDWILRKHQLQNIYSRQCNHSVVYSLLHSWLGVRGREGMRQILEFISSSSA